MVLFLFLGAIGVSGCFPRQAGPKLAHFTSVAPSAGDTAPDFALTNLSGEPVRLADLLGSRPVVLQLGSHTCPVYRYRRHSMRTLIEDYRDRVHFLLVYTTEAHPMDTKSPYSDDVWDPLINRAVGVRVEQAGSAQQRQEQARRSRTGLNLEREIWVDTMANEVWEAYGRAASPAFVIDRDGKIALSQPWVVPKGIRTVLDQLLNGTAESVSGDPQSL